MYLFACFLLCFLWQMYVHFRYFRLLALPTHAPKWIDYQPVSVVIAARNEAKNLPALLAQLGRQDYQNFEIIIVNDRSTDETNTILQASRQDNLHIIHIKETPEGINPKKHALQIGIHAARYDWLLLTDGDCLPADAHWISEMMRARTGEKTEIVLGIAPLRSEENKKNTLLAQFIQFETLYTAIQYAGFAKGGKPYMGVGRNLLYHKKLFEKIGGFGKFMQTTGGDDDLFINQVATQYNTQVCTKGALVYSSAPATWRAWYRQKQRHLSVGKHYKARDQMRLACLYFSQGGIWLSWFCSFFLLPAFYLIIANILFGVRSAIIYRNYKKTSRKFDCKISLCYIIFFDAIFILYLFIMGGLARYRKKIKWKK